MSHGLIVLEGQFEWHYISEYLEAMKMLQNVFPNDFKPTDAYKK
jgi:hypothetical protein